MKYLSIYKNNGVVRFTFVLLILTSCICCYSQNADSIIFANASWSVTKISKAARLYHYSFAKAELFGATENINFVKIKKRLFNNPKLSIAADSQTLYTTSDFAKKQQAIAAINGNFFDMKNGGSEDFTKVNGSIININKNNKTGTLSFHQKASIVIDKGVLSIKKWDGLVNWPEWLAEPNVMLNGPLLLWNNIPELLDSSSFNVNRHPRTALGITKNGNVIMLVVDGRNANSAGVTLFELTKIMRWLGCVNAINFDGGGSSTIWIREKGVINYPSDNKKWDHRGERKVANILYLK